MKNSMKKFIQKIVHLLQGPMGDSEYIAAFQQIVMPIAYEVTQD